MTYTLVAFVIRNDGENNQQHLQTISKQQDQWVMYNNDQTTLPISTNIFQDEDIQQEVTLLVYELNGALSMNASLHSVHYSNPEEGDVKERHLLAANVLVDLNRNTEKDTEKQADRGCAPGLWLMVESTYICTLVRTLLR